MYLVLHTSLISWVYMYSSTFDCISLQVHQGSGPISATGPGMTKIFTLLCKVEVCLYRSNSVEARGFNVSIGGYRRATTSDRLAMDPNESEWQIEFIQYTRLSGF